MKPSFIFYPKAIRMDLLQERQFFPFRSEETKHILGFYDICRFITFESSIIFFCLFGIPSDSAMDLVYVVETCSYKEIKKAEEPLKNGSSTMKRVGNRARNGNL